MDKTENKYDGSQNRNTNLNDALSNAVGNKVRMGGRSGRGQRVVGVNIKHIRQEGGERSRPHHLQNRRIELQAQSDLEIECPPLVRFRLSLFAVLPFPLSSSWLLF